MADYPCSVVRSRLPMTPEETLDAADVFGNTRCPAASLRGPVNAIEGGLSRSDSLSCERA
jgi:hypothetical protein